MRAVVQRVKSASVTIDNQKISEIKKGLLVFVGVTDDDSDLDIKYLSEKIINLRIFEDENEKMNLSLKDIEGELLIVSQFTLYGDCRKGRRPSFDKAGNPKETVIIYDKFVENCKAYDLTVKTGIFGADMLVSIENDGPATFLLDSKKLF